MAENINIIWDGSNSKAEKFVLHALGIRYSADEQEKLMLRSHHVIRDSAAGCAKE